MSNQQILLKSRPNGWPTTDNFELANAAMPEPAEGEVLLQTIYMSVDPYMRGRMNDAKSYVPPFQIGEACQAGIVAKVIASNGGPFKEGAYVTGMGLWANYMVTDGTGFQEIQPGLAPLSYYLGVLGMPGMTAYVGLKGVAELKEGDQLFVSAASGAVGQVVGQIGKNMGCHVAGSAGSDDKVAYLKELGFDEAFNYKTEDVYKAVKASNPKGIDVYFENVGGPILEAVINNLNFNSRVALCGMIANYNATLEDMPAGPRNMVMLVGRSVKMQGFIVSNYPDLCREWIGVGAKWLAEGKLKYRESVTEGIENAPQAFIDMLSGKNFGKQVIKFADE
ncbi:NADP-dependent oxidoreductase [Kordiimonas laminariae]|uniref:NADP-dependent oxidoreductase n=1 Tax=Kordiimonas laminariae TaxID=2917717 RepID=UPI001FF2DD3D|nr:NADP-dependent oxidoreductase [Kordiimonas laminariae]MCK0069918.1 NADP-dependent oxidoreductase [Kordiimonas laminariae]